MTLPEFLLARLAEDEAAARRLSEATSSVSLTFAVDEGERVDVGAFTVRRVLADVEAKRRIVELRETAAYQAERMKDDGPAIAGIFGSSLSAYDAALTSLALPYTEHPDYREEWRP